MCVKYRGWPLAGLINAEQRKSVRDAGNNVDANIQVVARIPDHLDSGRSPSAVHALIIASLLDEGVD